MKMLLRNKVLPCIFLVDRDLAIIQLNDAASALFEQPRSQLVGMPIDRVLLETKAVLLQNFKAAGNITSTDGNFVFGCFGSNAITGQNGAFSVSVEFRYRQQADRKITLLKVSKV